LRRQAQPAPVVNKRLITKQVLGDGNTIQIGATLFIFVKSASNEFIKE